MSRSDIIIAGGGMVGLASACLLARQGLEITLIDSGPEPVWHGEQSPSRVSALNLASQRLLQAIGVWQQIADKRFCPYRHMNVWDRHSDASISFDAVDYAQPHLGYIVENTLVTSCMMERLKQNYNVKLLYQSEVTALENSTDAQIVSVKGLDTPLHCDLVVAADGGQSNLRQMAGISVFEQKFEQDAVVATLSIEKPHQNTALQCFTKQGPVAMLPLNNDQCSLVWSCTASETDALITMDPASFCAALEQLLSDKLGTLRLVGERKKFPLASRQANQYQSDGIVLVGDAAHTIHPLAGLGANLGLLDAAVLAEIIESARSQGKRFNSHSNLRRYERNRKGDNTLAMQAMRMFNTVFVSEHPLTAEIRQNTFKLAQTLPLVKQPFAEYAIGLGPYLPAVCRPSV